MPRASSKLPKCLSTNHKARTPLAVPAHSHAILPQAQPQLPLALLRVAPAFYIISYHAEKRLALPCGLSSPEEAAGGQAVPPGLPAGAVHMASSTSPRSLFAALFNSYNACCLAPNAHLFHIMEARRACSVWEEAAPALNWATDSSDCTVLNSPQHAVCLAWLPRHAGISCQLPACIDKLLSLSKRKFVQIFLRKLKTASSRSFSSSIVSVCFIAEEKCFEQLAEHFSECLKEVCVSLPKTLWSVLRLIYIFFILISLESILLINCQSQLALLSWPLNSSCCALQLEL